MNAASSHSSENPDPIRRLDVSRDLDTVADLIEVCFPIHLDRDGQTYIRQMRKAARDMRTMRWFSTLAEMGNTRASGFVWEEHGQIIGNLSLIPFQQMGKQIHLIANVAVHQDHRRRGIARSLTKRALAYLRRQSEPSVWLQVRDDNPAAQELYRSVGFIDQFMRTTWRIQPLEFRTAGISGNDSVTFRRRKTVDWKDQQEWLNVSYPSQMQWNLPVDFRRFEPGPLRGLTNLLDGVRLRHWAFEFENMRKGLITWQRADSFANNLWLAFDEEQEASILPQALQFTLRHLSRRHPVSIDYPKDRSQNIFKALGFNHFRSLIWMQCQLK